MSNTLDNTDEGILIANTLNNPASAFQQTPSTSSAPQSIEQATLENPASAFSPSATALANAVGPSGFKATQGWYITGAIVVSVSLANTKAGPFLLGILSLALLYETGQLLQGK